MVKFINIRQVAIHLLIIMMFTLSFAAVGMITSVPTHAMSQICKVTGSTVYVRKSAGTSAKKVGTLNKDTYRLIKGTKKDKKGVTWYKVAVNNKTGYISSKYAKKVSVSVTKINQTGTVKTESSNLFARSGPGTLYGTVGKIAKGKKITLTGKAKDIDGTYWYQTKVGSKTAYVCSNYVAIAATATTKATTKSTTAKATIKATTKSTTAKATTKATTKSTTAKATTKATTAKATTKATTAPTIKYTVGSVSNLTGKVTTSSSVLNVRSGPATIYDTIGTLKKGSTFVITGKTTVSGDTWYRLTYNKSVGFVSASYVTTAATSTSTTTKATTATTTKATATTTKATTAAPTYPKASAKTLKARKAAVDWAIKIANDDSFHYGEESWAHKPGCYFCGTNDETSGKYKAGGSLEQIEKTYCCNPFVTAAYAHGAGAKEVSCTISSKQIGLADDTNKVFKTDSWALIAKPNEITELEPGDILLSPSHAMIYIGNGKIVHAASADDGVINSTKWNKSIRVGEISTKHWTQTTKIYRYYGIGRF